MAILEITAVPFTSFHLGGGERFPLELMKELGKYEDVIGCFSLMKGEIVDVRDKFIMPARFISLPPFISIHNPLPTTHSIKAMRRFLRAMRGEVEFIHVHNLRTAMSTAWLLLSGLMRSELQCKIILTDHLARFFPFPKMTSHFVDYYAAVSKISEQHLQTYARRPSIILPPAVSGDFIAQAKPVPFEHRNIDFLFLGRVLPQKRPDMIVKLTEEMIKRGYKDTRSVIAGGLADKEYLHRITDTIKSKNLESNITIMGNPTDSEVISLYTSSKINVLFSTQSDFYGKKRRYPELAPSTIIEAASCGTPSIVSDFPGADEQVIDGKTGFVIAGANVESAISKAEKIMDDKQNWNTMSFASREFVLSERTFPIVTKRFVDFLNRIRSDEL